MNREGILDLIKASGWSFLDQEGLHKYRFSKHDKLVEYTAPHSDNNFEHVIRGERKDNFSNWSEATIQENVLSLIDLISLLTSVDNLTKKMSTKNKERLYIIENSKSVYNQYKDLSSKIIDMSTLFQNEGFTVTEEHLTGFKNLAHSVESNLKQVIELSLNSIKEKH